MGSLAQTACPLGTYLPTAQGRNISDCISCPPGYYCNSTGLVSPTDLCNPGYFCANQAYLPNPIDGVTGNICPPGFYCPPGSSAPTRCLAGTYTDSHGNSQCLVCPAGYFCDGVTTDTLQICPKGHYCLQGTREQPLPCDIGTFSNVTGLKAGNECSACSPGSYCDVLGLLSPTNLCKQGFYCTSGSINAFGQLKTLNTVGCTAGYTANSSYCPPGHYCPDGTYEPISCPFGTYLPTTSGSSVKDCIFCPEGHYCNISASVSPSGLCDAGYYCKLKNIASKPSEIIDIGNGTLIGGDICPPGSYCPKGSPEHIMCAEGSYSIGYGAEVCSVCPEGKRNVVILLHAL